MIRVIYELDVVEGKEEQLAEAWREIVGAHGEHGALESALLRDEEAGLFVAISRWRSRAIWQTNRRDDAHPEAYARFRDACEVLSRRVLDEVDWLAVEE